MKATNINIVKVEITTKGNDILLLEYTERKVGNRFLVTWCKEGESDGEYFYRWLPDTEKLEYAKSPTAWAKNRAMIENNDRGYPPLTLVQAQKRFDEMVALVPTMQFKEVK